MKGIRLLLLLLTILCLSLKAFAKDEYKRSHKNLDGSKGPHEKNTMDAALNSERHLVKRHLQKSRTQNYDAIMGHARENFKLKRLDGLPNEDKPTSPIVTDLHPEALEHMEQRLLLTSNLTQTGVKNNTKDAQIEDVSVLVADKTETIRRAVRNKLAKCGENLIKPSGILKSIEYTNNLASNQDCQWRISASPGERIILNLSDIEVYMHESCKNNFLEIWDGFGHKSKLLGKVCGSNEESTFFESSSHLMTVKFRTSVRYRGLKSFTAEYKALCGGNIVEETGEFQSPNYPDLYRPGQTCVWTFTVPSPFHVALTFNHFELEYDTYCELDVLEVRDGVDSDSPKIGNFCGQDIPKEIHSTNNTLYLKFTSDSSIQDVGFSAMFTADINECEVGTHGCEHECVNTAGSYFCSCFPGFKLHFDGKSCEAICGGVLTEAKELWSPHYPENYPPNTECIWRVNFSHSYQVLLRFRQMKVEFGKNCEKDYVEIRNGLLPTSPLLGRFCGYSLPELLLSSTNTMLIKFVSDSSIEGRGFLASVTKEFNECKTKEHDCEQECVNLVGGFRCACHEGYTLQPDGKTCEAVCGQILSGGFGSFRSPDEEPIPRECVWKLSVPETYHVALKFINFTIYGDEACGLSFLEVRDGHATNSSILGRFCGTEVPSDMLSSSNKIMVKLFTDDFTKISSFSATFEQEIDECLFGDHGCEHDCVNTLGGYFCNCRQGFLLEPDNRTCGAICGENLSGESGVFSNENVTDLFNECVWKISVPDAQPIVVEFELYQENFTELDCEGNFLEIWGSQEQERSSGSLLRRLCADNIPKYVHWNGSYMTIKEFHTRPNKRIIFSASFHQELCGGDVYHTGELKLPYMGMKENITECIWNIHVPDNHKVALTVTQFQHQSDSRCGDNYLSVWDTHRENAVVNVVCSNSSFPLTLFSKENEMLVKLTTKDVFQVPTFLAKFEPDVDECLEPSHGCQYSCINTIQGYHCECPTGFTLQSDGKLCEAICGGVIFQDEGHLRSPNASTYSHDIDLNCIWTITVPPFYQVALHSLDFIGSCESNYLELRDGVDMSSPLLTRVCGDDSIPETVLSTTNKVTMKYVASERDSSFSVAFTKETDECKTGLHGCQQECINNPGSYTCSCHTGFGILPDGKHCANIHENIISAYPPGNLLSPNYPQNYPSQSIYSWVLNSKGGHPVTVVFNDFQVELGNVNCTYDHLAVYDGNSERSPLLGRFCGTSLPSSITASRSELRLVFKSDASITHKGFNITYKTNCGGNLEAMRYPLYLASHVKQGQENYENNQFCNWVITAPENRRIRLSVLSLDLEHESSCSYDYLEISYKSNSVKSLWRKTCGNNKPGDFVSPGNVVYITFRSDGSNVGNGFHLTYVAQ